MQDAAYYDDTPKAFFRSLEKVGVGNWIMLFRCKACGQHWSIDEWDKYVDRVITKINDVENWEATDSTNLRKDLLLSSRGGTTGEECAWAGCSGKQVKGVALCIDHLYATGARK